MYVKILRRQEDYATVLAQRKKLLEGKSDASEESILELICEAYCHLTLRREELEEDVDIEEYCELLLNINANSVYGRIARAIVYYENGDYIECRDLLLRGMSQLLLVQFFDSIDVKQF